MRNENLASGIRIKFLYVLPGIKYREFFIELEDDTKLTVGKMIDRLLSDGHLPETDVALARRAFVLVNGEPILYAQGWETQVDVSDQISFVAPLAGG